VMERLAIYHAGKEVDVSELGLPPGGSVPPSGPSSVPSDRSSAGLSHAADAEPSSNVILLLKVPEGGTTFDDIEREVLVQILARAEGNQSRAARSLGLSESTLRSRLKRLGLKG
ncbi:MAG: helix-turn-helix domain-containing protein, partial [Polyangiaceae bacterium]